MFKWKLAFPADRWWVDALRRGSESKWVQWRQWRTPSLWRRREICPKRCRKLGYPQVSRRGYILCVHANKFFYYLDWRSYQEQWHVLVWAWFDYIFFNKSESNMKIWRKGGRRTFKLQSSTIDDRQIKIVERENNNNTYFYSVLFYNKLKQQKYWKKN